jgi:hypothetical protein
MCLLISALRVIATCGVRLTTCFQGQVIGTSAGTKIYVRGGYHFTGTFGLGLGALMLVAQFARGPHAPYTTWLGWEGGARLTKHKEAKSDAEK